jgi:hypothetical protein
MRPALVILAALALPSLQAHAAGAAVKWEERPFFARRLGTPVPPPAFYATTAALPGGTEVTVKVLKSPKKAALRIHDFLGGPVFARGYKEFDDLAAGKVLTYRVVKDMKVGLTTRLGDQDGTCKGLEQKGATAVLKYSFGARGEVTLEVKVVEKTPLKEADLPGEVKDAFRKRYGDVKILTAGKETSGEGEGAKVAYEVVFEKGKENFAARFGPKGKFLSEEKVKDTKEGDRKEK